MGDTPNMAARMQGLAAPNTVALSAATARLVQGVLPGKTWGPTRSKGWQSRCRCTTCCVLPDPPRRGGAGPGCADPGGAGRGNRVAATALGAGQRGARSGGAGQWRGRYWQIGPGAGPAQHIGREGVARTTYRCSPYHTNSAFYPVIEHVQRLFQFARDDPPATRLAKLERLLRTYSLPLEEVVPLFAALLSVPLPEGAYPALALTPQQQRQQTYDALLAWLWEEARRQPVLVVWEDLHWADPSTLENLGLLLDQSRRSQSWRC